ncbi:SCO1664 family protein [Streptomyces uncialis]|uniref:SCO1664 family protein n=1 Tax=Streptomyces uncialis TaxID=1048205 RepID=UPI002256567F|nr:SCO1664 family protein [Streptomyces uncialis]MCX4662859.1 SCO1664 family protein [Streptomyces uncialis]
MSAPERIPPRRMTVTDLLTHGELTVRGRVQEASNAVLYCTVEHEGERVHCAYKPIAGERPLWDFPDGTLAQREVAAYEVSEALGWGLVPPTVLRAGPYGEGMCQLWIEGSAATLAVPGTPDGPGTDDDPGTGLLALLDTEEPGPGWKAIGFADVGGGRTALLVHADDDRLRRLAVLDAVINNSDRKGGHLLPTAAGRLYGIDHGVTFHTDDKLRTLLWGWAGEPLPEDALTALTTLEAALEPGQALAARLTALLTETEIAATRARVAALLAAGIHPKPGGEWPAIPWPPV